MTRRITDVQARHVGNNSMSSNAKFCNRTINSLTQQPFNIVHTAETSAKNTIFRPKSLLSYGNTTMTTFGAFTKHNSISDVNGDKSQPQIISGV